MRRLALVTIALVTPWLTDCSDGPAVPTPRLDRVEPAVAAKLNRCRDAVVGDRTAANWSRYARTLHAHETLAEAEAAYLAVVALVGPGAPLAFDSLHLAGCATLEWKPQSAVQHFTRAVALRDDFAATHLNLGVVSERLGRFDQAKKHYTQVLSRWSSSHANLGLGRLALIGGDANAALKFFGAALTINPNLHAAHEAMARAYARLGKKSESRAAALRAGDLERSMSVRDPLMVEVIAERVDVGSRIARGLELAKANLDAKAIAELEAAVASMPQHTTARFVLASILNKAGQRDAARKHLDDLLTRDRTERRALELRARISVEAGDRQAAVPDLEALLGLDPGHAWAKAELEKAKQR